jgi:hypothetical protein
MRLAPSALLWLAAATAAAQTRPFATEPAATAAAGSLVLELGADFIAAEPNSLTGRPRDRWDAPSLRLVYSPSDNVELDVEWVGRVIARGDPDFGNVSDFGDVSLRAKLRLREPARGGPAVSARFGITLPQTSFGNGLGPNTIRMAAQLLLSQPLGVATVEANAGLAIHDEALRPHEQRDFFAYGFALTRPARGFTLGVEVAGLAGEGAPGVLSHHEARLGLRYGRGRVRWDGALRRGLGAADGDWGVTAGLAWTLRR